MSKGAAVFPTPGDSPKRGLDTHYQKGHIGRSVAVVAFLAKLKIRNLAAGSDQILNFGINSLKQKINFIVLSSFVYLGIPS